jgi:peptidyl-prolyl cis-trans isomerase B (cyclophilin B)
MVAPVRIALDLAEADGMRTRLGVFGWLVTAMLTGCGGQEEASAPVQPPTASVPGPGPAAPQGQSAAADSRLNQSFQDATLQEPPTPDCRLPDITKTNKSVGKLYEAVVAQWGKVPFVTAAGKKLLYTATITTDLGKVQIALWPDVAPNHVRNFVALARAGYYDGLEFDRAVNRQFDDDRGHFFQYVEAGCPVASGEAGYGSIGYWMKPEFSTALRHDEGTVGAWHGEEVETAACKFYINLGKAEWMDGNFTLFGKITQGLEVVRAIHAKPVREDDFRDRPVTPVVMRSVTIDCREQ